MLSYCCSCAVVVIVDVAVALISSRRVTEAIKAAGIKINVTAPHMGNNG